MAANFSAWLKDEATSLRSAFTKKIREIEANAGHPRVMASIETTKALTIAFAKAAFEKAVSTENPDQAHQRAHDCAVALLNDFSAFITQVAASSNSEPVFFNGSSYKGVEKHLNKIRSDLEHLSALTSLEVGATKMPKPKGRPLGSGSHRSADEPLFVAMHDLCLSGEANSIKNAAARVVTQAAGSGTLESKEKRLARAYPKWLAEQEQKRGSH